MNQLVNYVRRMVAAKQISRVSVDIARRSYPAVWNRVRTRVFRMSQAEARGYIRARAMEVIEQELDSLMKYAPRLDSWFRISVRDRVLEEITGLIIADVCNSQRLSSALKQAA